MERKITEDLTMQLKNNDDNKHEQKDDRKRLEKWRPGRRNFA